MCVGRREIARRANERIATRAERLRFLSRVPMVCECSDDECGEIVLIALDDYRRVRRDSAFLTAPGHQS